MEDTELLMISVRLLTPPMQRIALTALLLSGLAMTTPLHAAPQVVMDAEDLDLSVPCLGRFEITVDPAMSDGVSIDSSTTGGAHLTMRTGKTQGSSKVLITSKSCAPTAKVSILVAPSVGVLIHDSHDTHFVINGTLASLEASLEAGQLDADTIQSLDLSLRGTEQVHIAHLNRAAQVVETGASGLVVDHAELDAFSAQLSETSHLTVTDGRVDVLTLMVENGASARLGGTLNTATVSANGTGLVAIPTVSGALTRTGNVQVGPVAAAAVTQPSAPIAAQPAPPVPAAPAAPVITPPVAPVAPTVSGVGVPASQTQPPSPPVAPTKPVSPSAPPASTPSSAVSGSANLPLPPATPASPRPVNGATVSAPATASPPTQPVPQPATPTTPTPGASTAQPGQNSPAVPDEQPWAVSPTDIPSTGTQAPQGGPVNSQTTPAQGRTQPDGSTVNTTPAQAPATSATPAAKGDQTR
ncbi:hypothetical protein GCM10007207_09840 [Asaia siamensis]|uniref:Auto-transporter adhesin head GIN domain-containing protein n=2 Tax=Asaia siamensis TaxID=110479 RepID=A0ABQ1LLP6_9PROT|nr:hypothetical protein GCM10007207_09840 [Asaia siamensis]